MDSVIVKPVGVYGSKSEIIRLMKELNVIDHSTYVFISYYQNTILKSYQFIVLLFSPLPTHTPHPTKRYALDYTPWFVANMHLRNSVYSSYFGRMMKHGMIMPIRLYAEIDIPS